MSIFEVSKDQNILKEAQEAVFGKRESDYDHPIKDFSGTALMMTGFLRRKLRPGKQITIRDVPAFMMLVKQSRESHRHTRDNLVDIAGYDLTLERCLMWCAERHIDPDDTMAIINQFNKEEDQQNEFANTD